MLLEPSAESVTGVEFVRWGNEDYEYGTNIIQDQKLIENIFGVIEQESVELYGNFNNVGQVYCYNDSMQGLTYGLGFIEKDTDYYFFIYSEKIYVLIPRELGEIISNYFEE
ncbi:MAG: hypothetical protein MJA31_10590 [Clostridia bacterium]|nr:hypothetical protein [Clostridia bacterium]